MNETRVVLATSALAVAMSLGVVPAEAASAIQITRVYVNAPGTDTASNASVNGEYVTLKNTSKSNKTLTGYTLRDESKHVYKFGTLHLSPGASVKVHTGKGTNTASKRYMGRSYHIWNNSGGDSATLKSSSGTTQDKCAWSGSVSSYVPC
ncbi:MAG TPA: lamin tail domain-containing protein [Propionibacteriaceae bacterium]|nr:lamin tail domain-containing protein [Propionibacteriaceae bacterium]